MRILVIGSGAIGGITAGLLAKKGFDVEIACKNADIADQINTDGLIFKIKNRRYIHFISAFDGVKSTPGNYDYILLTTKSFDIVEPTKDALEKLSDDGVIVSFQDGFCEEKLSRITGSDRLVGAVIGWGASMNKDGMAEMTSGGEMIFGKLDGSDDPRLDNLVYMMESIGHSRAVKNINEHIFSKLIINSCITTLGAISGYKVGALLTDKNLRNLFLELIEEGIAIADALKIEVPEFAGRVNYYKLVKGKSIYHRLRRHAFIRMFGYKFRKVKSSGLQSLERGEKTEIALMNGYIQNKGKELGIELPINNRLVEIMQEIENGKREISPKNLEDIYLV